jgi:hypothetical protein
MCLSRRARSRASIPSEGDANAEGTGAWRKAFTVRRRHKR